MRINLLSQDKLFNIATIATILCTIAVGSFFELGPLADIIALVAFGTLGAMNKVTFDNGIFFSNSGDELSHKLPTKFGQWAGMIVLITLVGGFIGIVPFEYNLFATVFTIILLYFVFTNCPMSILLNEDAWKSAKAVFGIKPAPQDSKDSDLFKRHRYSADDSARHNSPTYKYLPYNIHHHR